VASLQIDEAVLSAPASGRLLLLPCILRKSARPEEAAPPTLPCFGTPAASSGRAENLAEGVRTDLSWSGQEAPSHLGLRISSFPQKRFHRHFY